MLLSLIFIIAYLTLNTQAFETLSNPEPSVQLPRLKGLYEDFYAALNPLLPPSHLVLSTFSSPLSPTSSPLRSGILHISEAIAALRARCAPIRDAYLDTLVEKVDSASLNASTADLARLIVEVAKSILQLADLMKDDLSQFVLGCMSEQQLKGQLISESKARERRVTLELWSMQKMEISWNTWIAQLLSNSWPNCDMPRKRWVARLMQALGSTTPVSCPLPLIQADSPEHDAETESQPQPSNVLPPSFYFTCPALVQIQNYLQALVIVATLRSLVRLPSNANEAMANSGRSELVLNFTERVWILLKSEIDMEANDTKIVNLADEVVRVHRQACSETTAADSAPSSDEETRIRAAVDRTLHTTDPVFQLLQKRLLQAFAVHLQSASPSNSMILTHVQAGRERPNKRPRLALPGDLVAEGAADFPEESPETLPVIKGYEDKTLVEAVREVFQKLRLCVRWTEITWPDMIERE